MIADITSRLVHWRYRPRLLGWREKRDYSPPLCKGSPARNRSAPTELEARPEPGNGSAQGVLHLPEGRIIRVPLSRPEEAFEAILAVARHEVDMHVGDALNDDVVEGDERSIGG